MQFTSSLFIVSTMPFNKYTEFLPLVIVFFIPRKSTVQISQIAIVRICSLNVSNAFISYSASNNSNIGCLCRSHSVILFLCWLLSTVTCFPTYAGNFIVSACFGLLSVGILRGLYIKYILCKSIFVFCHQAGRDTDNLWQLSNIFNF